MTSVGFDGIELSGRGDGIFAGRVDELRAARRAGVVMPTAVVHMDHFIGDFDEGRRRDAIDQLKLLLSTVVEAGGTGIVSPHAFGLFSTKLPPFTPPRSDAESRRLLVEALREAGEHAVAVGAVVYLEPLNRYEDFVVNTLADAASIVDEVDSAGVEVIADTFHMSVEEGGHRRGDQSDRDPGSGTSSSATATGSNPERVTTTGRRPSTPWSRSATTAGWPWSADCPRPSRWCCRGWPPCSLGRRCPDRSAAGSRPFSSRTAAGLPRSRPREPGWRAPPGPAERAWQHPVQASLLHVRGGSLLVFVLGG